MPHKRKLYAQTGAIGCHDTGEISAEAGDAALPQQLAEGFARVGLGPARQGKQIDARGRRVYDADGGLVVVHEQQVPVQVCLEWPRAQSRRHLVGDVLHFGFTMATSLSL